MNKPDWLPENKYEFTNSPCTLLEIVTNDKRKAYQEGGETYTKSLISWLFEPCTEHLECEPWHLNDMPHDDSCYPLHRYKCQKCMRQLREWSNTL